MMSPQQGSSDNISSQITVQIYSKRVMKDYLVFCNHFATRKTNSIGNKSINKYKELPD